VEQKPLATASLLQPFTLHFGLTAICSSCCPHAGSPGRLAARTLRPAAARRLREQRQQVEGSPHGAPALVLLE
jgi:hypothetical protein